MTALAPFIRKEGRQRKSRTSGGGEGEGAPLMNCAVLEGQIKEGGGEFATRVMEDAINNKSREKKLEIRGGRGRRGRTNALRDKTGSHSRLASSQLFEVICPNFSFYNCHRGKAHKF